MMINSGVSGEEVLSSFKDLDLKTNEKSPDAPTNEEKVEKPLTPKQPYRGVEDLLGQPSSKFDYKVFYFNPASNDIPFEEIMPTGWGDEFEDEYNESYNVQIDNIKVSHSHQ